MSIDPILTAAIQTLKANWIILILARIFGKREVVTHSGYTATIYVWFGNSYLMNCVKHNADFGAGGDNDASL